MAFKEFDTATNFPRNIFEIIEENKIREISVDLIKKEIKVDNRLDLYKLLSALNLITFKKTSNQQVVIDNQGVPVLAEISDKVKFKNSFEKRSPNYTHPISVTIGKKDSWKVLGALSKALPSNR